jgi:hypothetical protein
MRIHHPGSRCSRKSPAVGWLENRLSFTTTYGWGETIPVTTNVPVEPLRAPPMNVEVPAKVTSPAESIADPVSGGCGDVDRLNVIVEAPAGITPGGTMGLVVTM